jgi:hypothetical protein
MRTRPNANLVFRCHIGVAAIRARGVTLGAIALLISDSICRLKEEFYNG